MRPRRSSRKPIVADVMEEDDPTPKATHQLLQLHEEAVASLSSLASGLDALEPEIKANEDERVAAQRLAGLLLRKDIEMRQPPTVTEVGV